jgi:hypothetical protein
MEGFRVSAAFALFFAQIAAAQPASSNGSAATQPAASLHIPDAAEVGCGPTDPSAVVVCGSRSRKYRIDSNVLAAQRAAEAAPSREQALDPDSHAQCIGPNCGGDFVPLVAVAIKVAKAAVDAATGEDWRQNFRTHPDEYSAYQEAKSKGSGTVSFSVSAGTSH